MRLENISLSWFRGAAESASLELGGKSAVVYGSNGAGKSTFADAIEWLIKGGKINHLAHEYSGPGQRRGIRNTHAPEDASAMARLEFTDGEWVEGTLSSGGKPAVSASDEALHTEVVQGWNPWTVLLRQDEVSKFVHATKGEKYSVLLPLLGLGDLEQAADNLHRLARAVRKEGALQAKETRLAELEADIADVLEEATPERAASRLQELGTRYIDGELPEDPGRVGSAVEEAIETRIDRIHPEYDRHRALCEVLELRLTERLNRLKAASQSLRTTADTLLERRVAVLEEAQRYAGSLGTDPRSVQCPVCGSDVDAGELAAHVEGELKTVQGAREQLEARDDARQTLARGLDHLRRTWAAVQTASEDDESGVNELAEGVIAIKLGELDVDELPDTLQSLESLLPQLESHIETAAGDPPPDLEELLRDQRVAKACQRQFDLVELRAEVESVQALAKEVEGVETAVRGAIADRSSAVMQQISSDVQSLWSKLHPDEPVEDVELYSPDGTAKAIDIALKFFGVDQDSPRLTLSEGHRNSLGLCIFWS